MPDPTTGGNPDGSPAFPLSPAMSPSLSPGQPSSISSRDGLDASPGEIRVEPEATLAAGESRQAPAPLARQARQKLADAAEGRKNAAADLVQNFAENVQRSGEQFAGQQDWIAGAIQRGADELNALATSLRERDARALLGEVRSFARQRPALFIGGALASGFAVARLGKLMAEDVSRADLPTIPEVRHAR